MHMEDNISNTTSGSHSINVGSGNDLSNSSVHVGDVYNNASPSPPIALIERVASKPVRVAGHQLHAVWLTVSGVLGFVASVVSIATYWKSLSFLVFPAIFVSAFLFIAGVCLSRQRFLRLSPLAKNLEADRQGRVFLTKIQGTCPLCDGTLKLREIGPKDHKETFVRCTRNPDHIWRFDFTVLDEPAG